MKLYNTTELKILIQKQNPNKDKSAISMFFSNRNYYENFNLKKIYLDNEKLSVNYIEEDFALKLIMIGKLNMGLSVNLNKIPFVKMKESISVFDCRNHQEYLEIAKVQYRSVKNIVQNRKVEKIEKIANILSARSNLSFDINTERLMSLDFEFFGVGSATQIENISEAGIATLRNGVINYNHYIISQPERIKSEKKIKLQNKFNFGDSIVINFNDFESLLSNELSKTDYLIAHSVNTEVNILKRSKINVKNIKLLDTLDLQKNFETLNKLSLKNHLIYHDIPFHHLHNAGNDAAYTLKLVIKMKETYISNLTLNKNEPKTKIKHHSYI